MSARARAREYMNKAKQKFGMSESQVRNLMKKANIRDLDSNNDIRGMQRVLDREKPKPTQSNKPTPATINSAVNRAVEQTGLSAANVKGIAKDIGIQSFDSDNDIRQVKAEIAKREETRVTSSPTYTTQVDSYNTLKDDYDKANEELTTANTAVTTLTTNYGKLETDYKTARAERDKYKDDVKTYKDDIDDYKNRIKGYESDIGRYRADFSNLSSQYQDALKGNQELVAARDKAEQQFRDQTAAYEAAKGERDRYREAQVGAQLSGLRGGATSGGGNQTSYGGGGGDLASGRTGYSSARQDRDRGLADYVREQGGATDSVLNREGPVVQLIGRSQRSAGAASGQPRRMTSGAGTGSYYASRFG